MNEFNRENIRIKKKKKNRNTDEDNKNNNKAFISGLVSWDKMTAEVLDKYS